MPFIIRTPTSSGDVREWSFDEAFDAAKKAVELLYQGTREFIIEAPNGRTYRQTEIAEMFSDARASDLRLP